MQEDFILEHPAWPGEFNAILRQMDEDPRLASARLMPCPGPKGAGDASWIPLAPETDAVGFTFQATLWRFDACLAWYTHICRVSRELAPTATEKERVRLEVSTNLAENTTGQREFWDLSRVRVWTHLAWRRHGLQSNAVYLCPFPYRPTAIVRGELEGWASELARREGIRIRT
jgi:hypothetical protein